MNDEDDDDDEDIDNEPDEECDGAADIQGYERTQLIQMFFICQIIKLCAQMQICLKTFAISRSRFVTKKGSVCMWPWHTKGRSNMLGIKEATAATKAIKQHFKITAQVFKYVKILMNKEFYFFLLSLWLWLSILRLF